MDYYTKRREAFEKVKTLINQNYDDDLIAYTIQGMYGFSYKITFNLIKNYKEFKERNYKVESITI